MRWPQVFLVLLYHCGRGVGREGIPRGQGPGSTVAGAVHEPDCGLLIRGRTAERVRQVKLSVP